jgi:hypothetical protein
VHAGGDLSTRDGQGVCRFALGPGAEPLDPYRAVDEYPELAPLLAMCERVESGWRFRIARAATGEIEAIQGMRFRPPVYMDVVRILSHTRAVVARAWLSGPRAGDFILHKQGPPGPVIALLLSLPEPEM